MLLTILKLFANIRLTSTGDDCGSGATELWRKRLLLSTVTATRVLVTISRHPLRGAMSAAPAGGPGRPGRGGGSHGSSPRGPLPAAGAASGNGTLHAGAQLGGMHRRSWWWVLLRAPLHRFAWSALAYTLFSVRFPSVLLAASQCPLDFWRRSIICEAASRRWGQLLVMLFWLSMNTQLLITYWSTFISYYMAHGSFGAEALCYKAHGIEQYVCVYIYIYTYSIWLSNMHTCTIGDQGSSEGGGAVGWARWQGFEALAYYVILSLVPCFWFARPCSIQEHLYEQDSP